MRDLVEEICVLHHSGKEIILVTSGAIAAGASRLGLSEKPKEITLQQASAAVGQSLLMQEYNSFFERSGKITAQVLLTEEDFVNAKRFENLTNAFNKLMQLRVIPIVNENDVVTTSELDYTQSNNHAHASTRRVFGDNDELSAELAVALKADLLVILSSVKGLLDKNNQVIRQVNEVNAEIHALDNGNTSGRGGFFTKLRAVQKACSNNVAVVIACGTIKKVLHNALLRQEGTFLPHKK